MRTQANVRNKSATSAKFGLFRRKRRQERGKGHDIFLQYP